MTLFRKREYHDDNDPVMSATSQSIHWLKVPWHFHAECFELVKSCMCPKKLCSHSLCLEAGSPKTPTGASGLPSSQTRRQTTARSPPHPTRHPSQPDLPGDDNDLEAAGTPKKTASDAARTLQDQDPGLACLQTLGLPAVANTTRPA